jgi:cytosine/adenosine deaminase-related metal-dependent hydrolase
MASIDAARSPGMGERLGSIEVGKWADITVLNLESINTAPLRFDDDGELLSAIVYAASPQNVETVIVGGRVVVDRGAVLDGEGNPIDQGEVVRTAQKSRRELLERKEKLLAGAYSK